MSDHQKQKLRWPEPGGKPVGSDSKQTKNKTKGKQYADKTFRND
jgi:hypothetical protein